MSLAINFLGREFATAKLTIVRPAAAAGSQATEIKLHYNPAELKFSKQNVFAEIPVPGLESPPLQFTRGGLRTLSMELIADSSEDPDQGVLKRYVEPLQAAMAVDGTLHAPPVLEFAWGSNTFTGVIGSLEVAYVLFHRTGVPLRAKMQLKLLEFVTSAQQQTSTPRFSPDVEKRYVVRIGETLSSIAAAVYRDPARWREIADANGIGDPRSVPPGTVLTLPRLEGTPT